GIVQMLGMPGKCRRVSISVWSSSNVMRSGVKKEKSHRAGRGQLEYQRGTVRHSDSGLSTTVVSTIENGAGSVGEVTRPAFPKTRSASGKERRMRSWIWRMRWASVTDIPGSAVGMYRYAPSLSGGMNSEPRRK